MFLRDVGDTEIGGFGITSSEDLLFVEDVMLVDQQCTVAEVELDDAAVADFFDEQVDAGRKPEEFARIWIHTHPGNSAQPSGTDEETFARVFEPADWAVMFILACGGRTYARLRYHLGPGAEVQLPVEVDYDLPFSASEHELWQTEYQRCVHEKIRQCSSKSPQSLAAISLRRLTDPWPAADDATAVYWENDDWPLDPEDCYDAYYDAWLDYTDPSQFPKEVSHDKNW